MVQLLESSFANSHRSPSQLLSQGEGKTWQSQFTVNLLRYSASYTFSCALHTQSLPRGH